MEEFNSFVNKPYLCYECSMVLPSVKVVFSVIIVSVKTESQRKDIS